MAEGEEGANFVARIISSSRCEGGALQSLDAFPLLCYRSVCFICTSSVESGTIRKHCSATLITAGHNKYCVLCRYSAAPRLSSSSPQSAFADPPILSIILAAMAPSSKSVEFGLLSRDYRERCPSRSVSRPLPKERKLHRVRVSKHADEQRGGQKTHTQKQTAVVRTRELSTVRRPLCDTIIAVKSN